MWKNRKTDNGTICKHNCQKITFISEKYAVLRAVT